MFGRRSRPAVEVPNNGADNRFRTQGRAPDCADFATDPPTGSGHSGLPGGGLLARTRLVCAASNLVDGGSFPCPQVDKKGVHDP